MKFGGWQKLTLLDFPGRVACTLFTVGCNLRCPFCHNASLVTADTPPELPPEEIFAFLEKRRGLLDGVCVTGGEPLLQPGLADFLHRVKEMGYLVKLDTNGTLPDRLEALLAAGLVDYVAMDIKNSPRRYAETVGVASLRGESVRRSASLLMEGHVPFEFRTTAVSPLHTAADFEEIGQWLAGDEPYFLQDFADSGDLIDPETQPLRAFSPDEMRAFLQILRRTIPHAAWRGEQE